MKLSIVGKGYRSLSHYHHWGKTTLPRDVNLELDTHPSFKVNETQQRLSGKAMKAMRERGFVNDHGRPNVPYLIAHLSLSMYERPFLVSFDNAGRPSANVKVIDESNVPGVIATLHPAEFRDNSFDTWLWSIKTSSLGAMYQSINRAFRKTPERPYHQLLLDYQKDQLIRQKITPSIIV